MHNILKS